MNRLFRLGGFAAAIALLVGTNLRADEKATKTASYAVVVGVGNFADKEIKPRPTADEDAKTIAGLLTDKSIGGMPSDHVAVLLSEKDEKFGAQEGTKANILKAIGDATKKVGKDDKLIIYMVMQGATAGEKPCLFATDSTFKDRVKTGILAGDLEAGFKDLKSEQVAIFLDFNLKAYDSKEAMLAPNIIDFVRVFLGLKENDLDAEPPPGRVVLRSGNGIQLPLVDGKNGLFTSVIADGLRGKADADGYEPDGIVTLDELVKYADKHIPEKAATIGKTPEEKLQALRFFGRGIHFTLTRNPEAAAKTEARLKKFEELQKSAKLDKTVAEEGEKLLQQMPRLKAMQELRKSYQKFADGDLTGEQLLAARDRIKAGMALSATDAQSFADKTYDALGYVRSKYIKKLNLGEMVANGIKGLYRVTETPLPDDLKDKLAKAKDLTDKDAKELLREARKSLGKREDLDEDKDVGIAARAGMAKFVDDYTTFFDKEKVEDLDKELKGEFTGIGVQIRRDLTRDGLLVVTPIVGSPAYKAGLVAGDLITEITVDTNKKGEPLDKPEVISTKGMETTDAVKIIVGKAGTKVKLKIEREGEKEPIVKELARNTIRVESVYGVKRNPKDDSWDYYIDPKNKIAYICLTTFAQHSAADMEKVVKQLSKDGVKGLVLDLRFNPGGYLGSAIQISDLFIDDGVIVSVREGNSRDRERTYRGQHAGSYLDFPMVCLVNEMSASGSEILSACLQDHGRAVIMGERSFGKGSVQNVEEHDPTGGKIKITVATFWPPSGRNLNKSSTGGKEDEDWGVRPDKGYELKLDRAEKDELFEKVYNWGVIPRRDIPAKEVKKDFKDRQLDMAVEYLRGQIKVSRNDKVDK
jgi:carboxyl-terminal processing protease